MEERKMKENDERRDAIMAELRCLHSSLDASSSTFGDWNMCKNFEALLETMKTATKEDFVDKFMVWFASTADDLKEVIEQRASTRARINELEQELEGNISEDYMTLNIVKE